MARSGTSRAESLTFDLSPGDVFGSVARYGAHIASLGRQARGVKLVRGGTKFAGQTCADFGEIYQLGAVTILDGPGAVRELVLSRRGRDAVALEGVFHASSVVSWKPPALQAQTDLPLWSAADVPRGLRFSADGMVLDSYAGLIGTEVVGGTLRFRVDVDGVADPRGRYRFLIRLHGRTWSNDSKPPAWVDRSCFTFVDLEPVDPAGLARLVNELIAVPTLRSGLLSRLASVESALARSDVAAAAHAMSSFVSYAISMTPDTLSAAQARHLVSAAFRVQGSFRFLPSTSVCGNGTRDPGEACDDADLGGFDCRGLGFEGGAITCSPICTLDTSGCTGTPVCGNGVVEAREECDNGPANSDSVGDACRTNCRYPFCGDDVIDSFEDCEGRNLDGATCRSEGFDRGTLRCDDECEYDYDDCIDDYW